MCWMYLLLMGNNQCMSRNILAWSSLRAAVKRHRSIPSCSSHASTVLKSLSEIEAAKRTHMPPTRVSTDYWDTSRVSNALLHYSHEMPQRSFMPRSVVNLRIRTAREREAWEGSGGFGKARQGFGKAREGSGGLGRAQEGSGRLGKAREGLGKP